MLSPAGSSVGSSSPRSPAHNAASTVLTESFLQPMGFSSDEEGEGGDDERGDSVMENLDLQPLEDTTTSMTDSMQASRQEDASDMRSLHPSMGVSGRPISDSTAGMDSFRSARTDV